MDYVFEGPGGADESPLHINYTCETKQKTRGKKTGRQAKPSPHMAPAIEGYRCSTGG
jgi:hypothetical protein